MKEWRFEASGDSTPGSLAPRVPRHRPLMGGCSGPCDQGRRFCPNPARCERFVTVRVLDRLKGAAIAVALVFLLGVLALHLWSR
jgi:hypothetical protein